MRSQQGARAHTRVSTNPGMIAFLFMQRGSTRAQRGARAGARALLTLLEWPVSAARMRPASRSNRTTAPSAPAVASRLGLPGAVSIDRMPPCASILP